MEHHDKIMHKFLPKLKRRLDECGYDSLLYALKWCFVVFQEKVRFNKFAYAQYMLHEIIINVSLSY